MSGRAGVRSTDPLPEAPYGILQNGAARRSPLRRRGKNRVVGPDEYVSRIPKHPSPYDFSEVADLVGRDFATYLAAGWRASFAADVHAYAERRRSVLLAFLRYCAAEAAAKVDGPHAAFLAGLKTGAVEAVSYADATAAYCARLHDRGDLSIAVTNNKRTRNNIINALGATLTTLARLGLLPLDHGMTAIPTGPLEPRVLTVAEVSLEGELNTSDPRAAFSKLLRSPGMSERLGIPLDGLTLLSSHGLAEAMVRILRIRIDALRACAVADLEAEAAAMAQGAFLLARTDLPGPADFMAALRGWRRHEHFSFLLKRLEGPPWAKLPGTPKERLLGLVVRAMAPHYSGAFFRAKALHPGLALAIGACGGHKAVTRHFEATMPAKVAAHLIVLIDTMLNVSVCDRLAADPFTGRSSRGKLEIATLEAIKRRAGDKVVAGKFVDAADRPGEDDETCFLEAKRVDGNRSGVWAIRTWLELSKPVRRRAELEGRGAADGGADTHLFMWILPEGGERFRGAVRRPHFTTDHSAWKDFMDRHREDPVIGGLPITREMIRVSCLQARSGADHDSGRVMMGLADHESPRLTYRYGGSSWREAVLAEHIRRFQNLLEAAASTDIEDIARILGISPEVVLDRRNLASQTGLGFFCLDPKAGERPGTVEGQVCDRLEDCPDCRLRRFVPNPEALEALWLFHKALRDERTFWEASNPERWRAIWLPWLAIVMAVVNILNSGRFKNRYDRAGATAAARLAAGVVTVPVLW